MDIENLDQAVRFKARLDRLYEAKKLIESHITTTIIDIRGGLQKDAPVVSIQDEALTGIIYKYCEDTIKLIEDAIKEL